MNVIERFAPITVGVDATVQINSQGIGGFLAVTAGNISVTRADGTVVFSGLPVTAGSFVRTPFYLGGNGGSLVAAGGASGVLGVS